ncbi:MAG: IclR family transcriptional regulator [Marinobacter sp.]|uniref:IclR family transcriptional regulator n=1 Tax=Marinobacter sp. TaxID=50741 RepID=UPI001B4F0440|nr:IclR family transcriptional regulator [Marinobacter sp.]MBQ0746552.1 IclR family transcriptional regulator [Marinobacter sp.]MBQ0814294.1 IclR family transcriptional regulator [Marinobacter sp.]|tara:strand:+ start:16296 stop:17072 length:777 start_codon:yes stop_codon:yes gene_type:complete
MTVQRREKTSSITRVLEIIESVSRAERPLSPADLALQLNIPKPSVHRILQQLEAEGYLQTNMRGLLVPADRLHSVALGVLYTSRFKALRQAILKNLADKVGETCGIAIPDGTEMIYYDRIQTNWPLQVHLPIGSRTPVWCTSSGKLYLSSLPEDRRQRIIHNLPLEKLARNTLATPEDLESALLETARNDRGIDNEEFVDGMVAFSVPIRDKNGRLFACLFTHAPILRKNLDELLEFEPLLRQAALELGELIGDNQSS